MKTTIETVTKVLNPELRDAIKGLWETSNCMDLEYGGLAEYLNVINQSFEDTKKREKALIKRLHEIRKLALKSPESDNPSKH